MGSMCPEVLKPTKQCLMLDFYIVRQNYPSNGNTIECLVHQCTYTYLHSWWNENLNESPMIQARISWPALRTILGKYSIM